MYSPKSDGRLANVILVGVVVVVGLDLSDEEPHDLVALVGEGVEEERLEERLRNRHLRHHHDLSKFVFLSLFGTFSSFSKKLFT